MLSIRFSDAFRPMSASERIFGKPLASFRWCWWRWRDRRASWTSSLMSESSWFDATMWSNTRSGNNYKIYAKKKRSLQYSTKISVSLGGDVRKWSMHSTQSDIVCVQFSTLPPIRKPCIHAIKNLLAQMSKPSHTDDENDEKSEKSQTNILCDRKSDQPVTCVMLTASMSSNIVPVMMQRLSSNREWRESVATWGLDHRSPPSSTSSSNLIHLTIL